MRWEPFREMEDIFRQYSPFFARTLRRGGEGTSWSPVADISETDKDYLIKAELPEVKKEDVKVTLDNGVITIAGERRQEKEQKEANEIRVESFYGSFSRSFTLPENVDANTIQAESKDGIVTVHVPKLKLEQKKLTEIKIQ
jgi:HSP20 family protein